MNKRTLPLTPKLVAELSSEAEEGNHVTFHYVDIELTDKYWYVSTILCNEHATLKTCNRNCTGDVLLSQSAYYLQCNKHVIYRTCIPYFSFFVIV